jgi:hypothetical protein
MDETELEARLEAVLTGAAESDGDGRATDHGERRDGGGSDVEA